ncbi:hypothetical protein GW17_00061991 [Ensete ventricosum]|nr:hypothetical protein GW17_00061991 [Ensete ventricosum]
MLPVLDRKPPNRCHLENHHLQVLEVGSPSDQFGELPPLIVQGSGLEHVPHLAPTKRERESSLGPDQQSKGEKSSSKASKLRSLKSLPEGDDEGDIQPDCTTKVYVKHPAIGNQTRQNPYSINKIREKIDEDGTDSEGETNRAPESIWVHERGGREHAFIAPEDTPRNPSPLRLVSKREGSQGRGGWEVRGREERAGKGRKGIALDIAMRRGRHRGALHRWIS